MKTSYTNSKQKNVYDTRLKALMEKHLKSYIIVKLINN